MLNAFVPQPLRPLHPCRPACLLPQAGLLSGYHPHPPPPGWSASDARASQQASLCMEARLTPRLRYLPPSLILQASDSHITFSGSPS